MRDDARSCRRRLIAQWASERASAFLCFCNHRSRRRRCWMFALRRPSLPLSPSIFPADALATARRTGRERERERAAPVFGAHSWMEGAMRWRVLSLPVQFLPLAKCARFSEASVLLQCHANNVMLNHGVKKIPKNGASILSNLPPDPANLCPLT